MPILDWSESYSPYSFFGEHILVNQYPHTVDGYEILHHHLGWLKPYKWRNYRSQLVQDFFHPQYSYQYI